MAAEGAQYAAQSQNANAQAKFENGRYGQTVASARANYIQQMNQIQNRASQDRDATVQGGMQNQVQGIDAKARATTTLNEHGVGGNSVHELLSDFDRIEGANQQTLATNLQWRDQQAGQDMLSAKAQAQGLITNASPAPVVGPNGIATGLQMAGTGLQGFDQVMKYQRIGPYGPPDPAPAQG